jgi:hypothetical protein
LKHENKNAKNLKQNQIRFESKFDLKLKLKLKRKKLQREPNKMLKKYFKRMNNEKPQGAWKSVGTHYTTMKKERMT